MQKQESHPMSDNPYVYDVTRENFNQQVVEASQQAPVLVDFWADWCQPCRMLSPVLDKLARDARGALRVAKVNADSEQELAAHFGVRSLPTVKIVHQGRIVNEFVGAQPESAIRKLLEPYLAAAPEGAVDLLSQARELAAQGQITEAAALLQSEGEPQDSDELLELAGLLALTGELARAEALLERLPQEKRTGPEGKKAQASLELVRSLGSLAPRGELEHRIAVDEGDLPAKLGLARYCAAAGQFEQALELFLEIMRRNRKLDDDAGRRGLLQVFDLLGNTGELVSNYRRKMAALLY